MDNFSRNQPDSLSPASARAAYLLGICGMGVGPLAIYMQQEGWHVSGWDDATDSPMAAFLRAAGIPLTPAFDPATPPALIGYSSAIKPAHPVRAAAEAAGLRLLRRGELLAERVNTKKLVAVCGSHGKTTTSGMLVQALLAAGADPGYVLGGLYRDPVLAPARANAASPWVVAEIDESDGTISHFSPEITVAVNLDWDHPDYYKTEADLEAVFAALFRRTRGAIFIPAASERLCRIAASPVFTAPVFTVEDGPGGFNAANERMALAVTHRIAGRIGTPSLGRFSGIRRRQDVLFENATLRLMADYAHHPTEINALLHQLRNDAPERRLCAVFQPHRHTRTRQYAKEFASALALADEVVLLPVYSAGEAPVQGGTTASVLDAAQGDPRFFSVEDPAALPAHLDNVATGTTTLVFIGAGDIGNMAAARARALRRRESCIRDYPLGPRTTFATGGSCAWFAEPATLDALRQLLRDAAADRLSVLVLGRGSNLLVADTGFPGLVLRPALPGWREICVDVPTRRLVCGAGAPLREIARKSAEAGLDGFAFLDGIPGTLGGALRMNAGAAGTSIFERVENVTWLDASGALHEHQPGAALGAIYRDCPSLHGGLALGAELLASGHVAPEAARELIRANAARRLATQPREPSAGSVFKNPPGDSAGRLIDSLGLKGFSIGGAAVSAVHANFIVNANHATASDILALIRRVRDTVHAATGVLLEPEIILAGERW